ncbi:arylesterase monooxygenase [Colletotrichum kahawae]|uniref:Arylesterase monooxygenase n=1 Tax=Colletotrichum kahawae TaxID=34407 RepID=A0AAD9XWY3_COLKA|nr:arylesterase monooxygenase [Colletotrichum kahawae]
MNTMGLKVSNSRLQFNPEYAAATLGQNVSIPTANDVFELRRIGNNMLENMTRHISTPDGIIQTDIPFQSHDSTSINLRRFTTETKIRKNIAEPAVLYVHGGGMVSGSVDLYSPIIASLAKDYDISFFAVDYRLAPENKGPNLAEDVFAGLKHLSDNAEKYNIDPKRIAIMGDSAGGGLAAAAALLARDRALDPPLAKQVLIYPMLDDRTKLPENAGYRNLLLWTEDANSMGWGAVLGNDIAGDPEARVSIYAAPV